MTQIKLLGRRKAKVFCGIGTMNVLFSVALCGMGGYEEFFRTSWFRKISSWIDIEGCMVEFENFEINRTRIRVLRSDEAVTRAIARQRLARLRSTNCHHHPMAMSTAVLALAIRHALHYLGPFKNSGITTTIVANTL